MYDAWKSSGPHDEDDRDPVTPCCVCTGDLDAPPCGEDCEAIVDSCERKLRAARLEVAAESALFMVKRYLDENPTSDRRVVECVDQIGSYLREIRALRAA